MWQVGSRQVDSWTDGCTKGLEGLQSESGKRGRLRASTEVRMPKTAAPQVPTGLPPKLAVCCHDTIGPLGLIASSPMIA